MNRTRANQWKMQSERNCNTNNTPMAEILQEREYLLELLDEPDITWVEANKALDVLLKLEEIITKEEAENG